MSNPSGDVFFFTPTGDLSGWLPEEPQKAHQTPTFSIPTNEWKQGGLKLDELKSFVSYFILQNQAKHPFLRRLSTGGDQAWIMEQAINKYMEREQVRERALDRIRLQAHYLEQVRGRERALDRIRLQAHYLDVGTLAEYLERTKTEPRVRNRDFHDLPSLLKRCLLYISLFPKRYELHKDALIHFWMAVGFITHHKEKSVEDVGNDYFEELLSLNLLQVSDIQLSSYYVEERVYDLVQEYDPGVCVRVEDDRRNNISEQTLHVSVVGDTVDQVTLLDFGKVIGLRSLLLLHDRRKRITRIPYDLFLKLNDLRVLDLSGTRIKELPSSVGNLAALHYLDLSETRIKRLPQVVTTLFNLQILKLRDCLDFTELPKDMKDMIYLRHLELDIIHQLTSMPLTMGTLTNLQTLSAFIVGKDYGYGIAELQYMNNLRGPLSIMKLENIVTWQDAEKAKLWNKKYLHRLVL